MSNELLLLRQLSEIGRQIISLWRARIIYQRNEDPFINDKKVKRRIKKLRENKLVTPIREGNKSLWQASSPYIHPTNNIYELANEAYPLAVLSYSSALEVHRLTDQRSHNIHLCIPNITIKNLLEFNEQFNKDIIPPDTELNDWQLNKAPNNVNIKNIWDYTIKVHSIKKERYFGTEIKEVEGVNIKTYSLEKVLTDGLKDPKFSGGLNEVFRCWVRGLNQIDLDKLVNIVEQYDITILYQRVGYVAETLGLNHASFETWKKNKAPRGGSRLLNPQKRYANTYNKEWNISINHPVSILENKDADYS
jgi:predicted transcriptional regulator of viral defense system